MVSFDGVVSRRIYINTKYVLYNVWKVGMLYSGDLYGVYNE